MSPALAGRFFSTGESYGKSIRNLPGDYRQLSDWGQEEKGTTEDEMAGWHH